MRMDRTARVATLVATVAGALALGLAGVTTTAAIDQTVEIRNVAAVAWQFEPQEVRIRAGDSVTWVDRSEPGSEPHTVTPDTAGAFRGSVVLRPGDQHVVRFDAAGEFAYHCDIHPAMVGRVIVAAAPATSPTPSASPAPTLSAGAGATQAAIPTPTPSPAPSESPAQPVPTPPVPTPPVPTPPVPTPSAATPSAAMPSAAPGADPAPLPADPDRGILPLVAILLAASLALLLGRRLYLRGR